MPIKVTCSKCQGVLHAPDDAGGKRGKCPTCGNVLAIPGGGGSSLIPPEPHSPLDPTPFNAAAPARQSSVAAFGSPPADEGRRSSFAGGLTGPPPGTSTHDARKASGGRLAAPVPDAPPPARKSPDPFTKPGVRPAQADAEAMARHWRGTRRGLWFVQAGYFFALVAVLAPVGLRVATMSGVALPDKPGVLKLDGVRTPAEITAAAFLVPAALAFVLLAMGRTGAASAPRGSFARGLLQVSSLATWLSLFGVVAVAVVVGMQIAEGNYPSMLPGNDPRGIAQRVGVAVGGVLAPIAELWFVIALGRLGAGLHDGRLAGRGTRALVYAGLLYALAGFATYAVSYYHAEIQAAFDEHVDPKLTTRNAQAYVLPGVIAVVGLAVWLVYARLVGAARGAVYGWLDVNRG